VPLGNTWLSALPWIGGLLAVLLCIHLLATWMEDRGWINYRKPAKRGYGAAVSNAMAEFDALINPAAEHRMAEERYQDETRSIISSQEPEEEETENGG
jgi:hypothetical protein